MDKLLAAMLFALSFAIVVTGLAGILYPKFSAITLIVLITFGFLVSFFTLSFAGLVVWIVPAFLVVVGALPVLVKMFGDKLNPEQEKRTHDRK
jgi:hypothetical protein